MFKIMAFMSRKPGMSKDEFRRYYEESHVRLIAEVAPAMRSYRRNYVDLDTPFVRDEDQIDFDVVTEMEFDSEVDCRRWFDAFREPGAFARVVEDERQFLDVTRVRVCAVAIEES